MSYRVTESLGEVPTLLNERVDHGTYSETAKCDNILKYNLEIL